MKDEFFEYYTPKAEEFRELWRDAIIVPDANILLHFLRLSDDYTETLFNIFEKYESQLWIPHQAALEYHKHKEETIIRIENAYEKLKKAIEEAEKAANDKIIQEKNKINPHPYLNLDELTSKISKSFRRYTEEIQKEHNKHPDKDFYIKRCENIASLFENKIGIGFNEERLDEIYKDGERRYEKNIPPGYSDVDKESERERYGDLVLWEQLIQKAYDEKKPIIFITDDMKEDWWKSVQGKTLGPRPELRREMFEKACVDFYLYNFDSFLEHASRNLKDSTESEKVNKIRKDVREHYTSKDVREHHTSEDMREYFTAKLVADELNDLEEKIQEYDNRLSWLRKEFGQIKQEQSLVLDSYPKYRNDFSEMDLKKKLNKLDSRKNELHVEIDKLLSNKKKLENRYYELKDRHSHMFPSDEDLYRMY